MHTFNLIDTPNAVPPSVDTLHDKVAVVRRNSVTIHINTTDASISTQEETQFIQNTYIKLLQVDSAIMPMIDRLFSWSSGAKFLQKEFSLSERDEAYKIASEILEKHLQWFQAFHILWVNSNIFNEMPNNDIILGFQASRIALFEVKDMTA